MSQQFNFFPQHVKDQDLDWHQYRKPDPDWHQYRKPDPDPDRYQTDADPHHWVQGASLPGLVSKAEIYSIQ